MPFERNIDPVVDVETFLTELFQKVFQNDAARRYMGFSQISQGSTQGGFPQWYLWLNEKRGAYSLTVQEGYIVSGNNSTSAPEPENNTVVGIPLIVRYFPDVEEEIFESFSHVEQLYRRGPDFDSTGTPSFEGGRTMDEGLFVAGNMCIVIYSSKADIDFYCSAPNKWRDYRADGLALIDDKGEFHQVVSPGGIDRDFPGWQATFFVFDKIISSFCFMTGQAPRYVGAGDKPSFHYVIDGKQNVNAVKDADITESIIGVSFFNYYKENEAKKRFESLSRRLNSNDYNLIGIWKSPDDIPAVWRNPGWWEIKDIHFHSESDEISSCYMDH